MTPTLLSAKSVVVRCAECNHWLYRTPTFLFEPGKGDQCPRCGCTSFSLRPGRPYGPKCRDWPTVLSWFENVWQFMEPHEFDLVTTDPPLAQAEPEAWG